MDTNTNNISSSSYCFSFAKCAREAASLGAIGHGDREAFSSSGSPFYEANFGIVFFLKIFQLIEDYVKKEYFFLIFFNFKYRIKVQF